MKTEKEIIEEEIETLENKYEIETLEPTDLIEDWFIEFKKDINNLIQKALSNQKERMELIILKYKRVPLAMRMELIKELKNEKN